MERIYIHTYIPLERLEERERKKEKERDREASCRRAKKHTELQTDRPDIQTTNKQVGRYTGK